MADNSQSKNEQQERAWIPQQVVECTICNNRLVNPQGLRCGHVYCNDCIRSWLSNHQSCPHCREKASVADLKPSWLVKNIIDEMKEDPLHLCNHCSQNSGQLSFCDHCKQSLCQRCQTEHTQQVAEDIRNLCDELISVTAPELDHANDRIAMLMADATSAKENLTRELEATLESLQMQILQLQNNSVEMLKKAKDSSHPNLDKRISDVEMLITRIESLTTEANRVIERRDLFQLKKLDNDLTQLERDIEAFQSEEQRYSNSRNETAMSNLKINPAYEWIASVIEETDLLRRTED